MADLANPAPTLVRRPALCSEPRIQPHKTRRATSFVIVDTRTITNCPKRCGEVRCHSRFRRSNKIRRATKPGFCFHDLFRRFQRPQQKATATGQHHPAHTGCPRRGFARGVENQIEGFFKARLDHRCQIRTAMARWLTRVIKFWKIQ